LSCVGIARSKDRLVSLASLQDAKEQVRQAVDIVDLVGSYATLRRQGRGYVTHCPWHDDQKPSLQVNPDRQSWKCWVCDIGGDIFSWVMRAEGLEFREALEMLAERAGVNLAPVVRPAGAAESQFDRRNLLKVVAWAEEQYHACLMRSPDAEPARRYLTERGISSESATKFRIGFAPNEWDWLTKRARAANISEAVLERVDCASPRDNGGVYDRFRGRLMFSIRDVRSRPIAFGGRVLPEFARENDAKYINSRETPLFNKSSQLYALDAARDGIAQEKCVLVMEGYTDVIMAHQHGVTNAVAVLGTALGAEHLKLVRRFTDSITLVLDGDAAGQRRATDILDNLLAVYLGNETGSDLKILTLPEGADPCDVISSHGCEHFRRLTETSVDILKHKITTVTNGLAQGASVHRSTEAVEAILSTLARTLPRGPGASSMGMLREQSVLPLLSREFGIAEQTLLERLTDLRRSANPATAIRGTRRLVASDDLSRPSTPASAWDRELLEIILHHPDSLAAILDHIGEEHIDSPTARALFTHVLELHHNGETPSFARLMNAVDDEHAKNLLVDCDEQGAQKSHADPRQRVSDLLAHISRRRQDAGHRATVAQLKQNQLDPEQEDRALAALFDDLKRRQTGSPPTDG
jgi:DNA primase